jgi:tetratricopeptide (TPR) repeat protein
MRCKASTTLLAGFACAAWAEPSSELLDLAARVHYGYYHAEPRAIDAARAALDRLADSPEVLYYRDFAAVRRAQLGDNDRLTLERLAQCAKREVPGTLDKRAAAEAWVLVAACAGLRSDESGRDRALALARERDDDNPRIALVEAWALEPTAGADAARREAHAQKLAAALEAFDAWAPSIDDPDWGHAETLAALGAAALAQGQQRAARDYIERALLLAPDYRAALELRGALTSARGGDRTL